MTEPNVPPVVQNQRDGPVMQRLRPHPLMKNISREVVFERDEELIEELQEESPARQDAATSSPLVSPSQPAEAQLPDQKHPASLDGGYGWLVVFGCFLMHIVNVGLIKSFGIIFVVLREKFGATNYEVSWIFSIFLVCSTWFAPLAGFLANAFSQRTVVMIGGLLLGLGISLGYFANRLLFLYFSYGCLSGLGSALAYTPAVVAVGSYFDKRRALANGISLSGAALGSITVPYLTSYLVDVYTVSGAILICGSIAFNVCVAGALLRPINTHMKILRAQERTAQIRALRRLEASLTDAASDNKKAFSAPASARSNGLNSLYERDTETHTHLLETPFSNLDARKRSSHSMPGETLNSVRSNIHELPVTASRAQNRETLSQRISSRFKRKEGQAPLFDFGLFRQRLFIVYALSVMLATFAYMNVFVILPPHVVDLGYSRSDAALFIAVIGVADFFARIGFGWFSDLKLFHRKWGFCGAISLASVCNFMVYFAGSNITLGIYAGFLGLTSGSYISLVAVVCVDFFGIDRLSSALGSVIAFQGAAFLAGPPLIALIRDRTGSYRMGFIVLSVCLILAALLIVLEHLFEMITSEGGKRKPKIDLERNHDMTEMQVRLVPVSPDTISSPVNEISSVVHVGNNYSSPPIAHIEEFEGLTPRPVSKPVFKPKLKRRVQKEHVAQH